MPVLSKIPIKSRTNTLKHPVYSTVHGVLPDNIEAEALTPSDDFIDNVSSMNASVNNSSPSTARKKVEMSPTRKKTDTTFQKTMNSSYLKPIINVLPVKAHPKG